MTLSKRQKEQFLSQPEIGRWINSLTLKPTTVDAYVSHLARLLGDTTAAELLRRMEQDPRGSSQMLKTKLSQIWKKSPVSANLAKNALVSFLKFNEIPNTVRDHRMRIVRRFTKSEKVTWNHAQEVIASCREPYRGLFKFMLMTGAGTDEIMEIQNGREIQQKIESQRGEKFTRIDLLPRKSNVDTFYLVCPTEFVPKFPVTVKAHVTHEPTPITPHGIQGIWRRAARRAGFYQLGYGVHQLRRCFKSTAQKYEVAEHSSEFAMGHGSDKLGYPAPETETQIQELSKLWDRKVNGEKLARTESEVESLKQQLKDQQVAIDGLVDLMKHPEKWAAERV